MSDEPETKLTTPDFIAMDQADEEQLKEIMQGRIDSEWVYDVRGKKCLTLVGIDECRRVYEEHVKAPLGMECLSQGYTPDGQWITLLFKSTDPSTGSCAFAGAEGQIGKEFWYRAAVSKAERNAIRKLLPPQFLQTVIDMAVAQGKVKVIASRTKFQPNHSGEDHEAAFEQESKLAVAKKRLAFLENAAVELAAAGSTIMGEQAELDYGLAERQAEHNIAQARDEVARLEQEQANASSKAPGSPATPPKASSNTSTPQTRTGAPTQAWTEDHQEIVDILENLAPNSVAAQKAILTALAAYTFTDKGTGKSKPVFPEHLNKLGERTIANILPRARKLSADVSQLREGDVEITVEAMIAHAKKLNEGYPKGQEQREG